MSDKFCRHEFADFLDRLAASRGRVGAIDWNRFAVQHYPDDEIEEMRRTVVRLAISWEFRDWPELNWEMVSDWAKQIRGS